MQFHEIFADTNNSNSSLISHEIAQLRANTGSGGTTPKAAREGPGHVIP